MKKIFKLITLSLIILLSTGCAIKEEYGIKIGKDKNVSINILTAVDNELIDSVLNMANSFGNVNQPTSTETHSEQQRWQYLESGNLDFSNFDGFTKEKYEQGEYKGYKLSLDLGNIDKLVTDKNNKITLDKIGKGVKIFTKNGNTYKLNLALNETDIIEMEEYKNSVDMNIKLKITLPNKAKSSNATKVEGNTYIWDLTKENNPTLTFEIKDSSNIMMTVGIIVVLMGIGAIIYVVMSKKKNA